MRLAALILILAALPGLAAARHGRPSPRHHPSRPAPARHTVFSISVDDITAAPPVYRAAAPAAGEGRLRLAVDRRLGHSGWVGSLGYHTGDGAPALDPHAVNSAASVQLGQPGSSVGAKVSLPF
jgi:hypothetical protein